MWNASPFTLKNGVLYTDLGLPRIAKTTCTPNDPYDMTCLPLYMVLIFKKKQHGMFIDAVKKEAVEFDIHNWYV